MKIVNLQIFLSLFVYIASAQSPEQLKKIDQLFSAWNNATPGVAVAVQHGQHVIYNKAFGLADLEHNIPNTTETVFESGSVAKQFTAMSILFLAAEGKLALIDDIRKYVPEIPTYGTTITVQMLLNHTSGLKDWGSVGALTGWPRTTRVYTQDLALQIMSKQKSTNYTPGTEYSYSNANYSLLVTIVERVSGKSLAAFTEENFFKPLGMTQTQWRDNFREVVPNRAIAYQKNKGVYEQLMPFEDIHGHGGLLTTTGDLLKWNSLLETHAVGGDRVYQWRVKKGVLTQGREISYAGGLFIDTWLGFNEISHSGATAGYRAWLAYYPQQKLSIVALSNDAGFNPTSIGRQIAEVLLDNPKSQTASETKPSADVSLSDVDLKKFEGTWRSIRHLEVVSFTQQGKILYQDQKPVTVLHRDTLFSGRKFVCTKPNQLLMIQNQDTLTFRKVRPPDLSPASLNALTGIYYSAEAEATYSFAVEKNQVVLRNGALPAKVLIPVYKLGFCDDDYVYYEFKTDAKGRIAGLEVSVSRATRVPFQKIR